MTFGEWVRRERDARHWSQAFVARRAGVTRSQMCNIEAGTSRAGAEVLQAIYALFGKTPEQVQLEMDGAASAPEPPTQPQTHPGIEALVAVLRAGPEGNARLITELQAIARDSAVSAKISQPGQALDIALALLRGQRR